MGEKIRKFREKQGWSQKQLAEHLGVHQSCVHLWETGKTFPRIKHINALSVLFGCEPKDLF